VSYDPGMLDQRISIMRSTMAGDGVGGSVETQTTYASMWAHVRPMKGREREAAMRTESRADYLVVVRNRADLLESDVIRWNGRDLNIRFIRNAAGRPLYLEIEAEMGPATAAV